MLYCVCGNIPNSKSRPNRAALSFCSEVGMENKKEPIIQPIPCRTCIWGRWQDTKQYCSMPKCVKEGGKHEIRPTHSRLT